MEPERNDRNRSLLTETGTSYTVISEHCAYMCMSFHSSEQIQLSKLYFNALWMKAFGQLRMHYTGLLCILNDYISRIPARCVAPAQAIPEVLIGCDWGKLHAIREYVE